MKRGSDSRKQAEGRGGKFGNRCRRERWCLSLWPLALHVPHAQEAKFDTPAYWGARCRWQIAILASIGFDFLRLPVGPASLYNQAQPGVLIPAALAALDTVSPIGFACLP